MPSLKNYQCTGVRVEVITRNGKKLEFKPISIDVDPSQIEDFSNELIPFNWLGNDWLDNPLPIGNNPEAG